MTEKNKKQAELKIFKFKKPKVLEKLVLKKKKIVLSSLNIKPKKGSKYYPKYKKIRKKLKKVFKKENIIIFILAFVTLAMLATSILPYML